MSDEKTIVGTQVTVSIDFPTIRESASDFGLNDDVTAQDVVDKLRNWSGGAPTVSTLVDWELLDDFTVYVNVETDYSDGSRKSTNGVLR